MKTFLSKREISKEFPELTRWKLEKILEDDNSKFPEPVITHKKARPVWRKSEIQRYIDIDA